MSTDPNIPSGTIPQDDVFWMLEQAANLLDQSGSHVAAMDLFAYLLKERPEFPMAWFGFASATYGYASKHASLEWLQVAIAAVQKMKQLDPQHEWALNFLAAMVERTPLSQEQVDAVEPLTEPPENLRELTGYDDSTLPDAFQAIPQFMRRTQLLMWLTPYPDPTWKDILLPGIQDPHETVRRAALKRLLPDRCDARYREALEELYGTEKGEDSEPYLSRCLRSLARDPELSDWATDLIRRKGDPDNDPFGFNQRMLDAVDGAGSDG